MSEILSCANCPRLQPLRKRAEVYQSEMRHHQSRYERAVIEEAASIIEKDEWAAAQSSEGSLEDVDPEWTLADDLRKTIERAHDFLYTSSRNNQEASTEGFNYNASRFAETNEEINYYIDRCPDKTPTVTKEHFGIVGKEVLKCSSRVGPPVFGNLPEATE